MNRASFSEYHRVKYYFTWRKRDVFGRSDHWKPNAIFTGALFRFFLYCYMYWYFILINFSQVGRYE